MSAVLEVMDPGMYASVQDLGRAGHQAEGVPVSGAMDAFALEAANLLLGNEPGAAALEIALKGPVFRVLSDVSFSVCGADFAATLAGAAVPPWTAVLARAGDTITFRSPQTGVWTYLAIAGGIDVPLVLGSRSTYLRGGFGGYQGRLLRAADVIRACAGQPRRQRAFPAEEIPRYGRSAEIRAVPGPQEDLFEPASVERFYSDEFQVTAQSDRMGYRLQGPPLRLTGGAELFTDGTAAGAVQVPPGGQPIVLMADRQTTGGYAKIATVISSDVPRLAQLAPGGAVRFRRVSVAEAQEAGAACRARLRALARSSPAG